MAPLIGITVDATPEVSDGRTGGTLRLNWNYAQAVADAGGVPLLIPPMADMERVAKVIDGWMIPGGLDIDAARYGEANHARAELQDPARYEGESRLLERLPKETPILGICYGCQFLNVVRGGNLIQHLPDVLGHDAHAQGGLDRYEIEDSQLRKALRAPQIEGKSFHHQAIDRVGSGLRIVGKSGDGTVEAIEATDRPWTIGVQWHPERTFADPTTRRLFDAFIEACR